MSHPPETLIAKERVVGVRAAKGADVTGSQLLDDFARRRDEAAFAELVRVYGPLVYGVCRRVVGNHHDAEDAFQATFLILSRKAASVRNSDVLPSWLYRVAYHVSLRAKKSLNQRRVKETPMSAANEPVSAEPGAWSDLEPILDLELNRLSEKYRAAIVLCDLGGSTLKEAATELGWSQGTLATRLNKARAILAERLARHGFALPAGALAVLISQNAASAAVPATLAASTVQTAGMLSAGQAVPVGLASSKVTALAQGTMKSMLLVNLKVAAVSLVVVAGAALGLQIPSVQPKADVAVKLPQAAAGLALPAEVQAALEQNAKQLSPITVRYTRQVKSRISEQETFEWLKMSPESELPWMFNKLPQCAIWQEGRFYASTKSVSSPPGRREKQIDSTIEWSFDGTNQYRGMIYDAPETPARLTKKSKSRGRIGEMPVFVMSSTHYPYFKRFSGLSFRQNGEELTELEPQSDLLALLREGGQLRSVENVVLDDRPHVKIEVMAENGAKRRADAVDLARIRSRTMTVDGPDGKPLQLEAQFTVREQMDLIENINQQRSLPATRRHVYYLDPAMNYALRRREEWYDPDRLLVRCESSEFEKLPNRPVWLPRHWESEIHEFERYFRLEFRGPGHISNDMETLSFLFEDSFLTEVVEVQKLSGEPVPAEQFVLNYTQPGTQIVDDTEAVQTGERKGGVGFAVGQTPAETLRNKEVALNQRLVGTRQADQQAILVRPKPQPIMRWFLIGNSIAILLVGAFFAYRRFFRS